MLRAWASVCWHPINGWSHLLAALLALWTICIPVACCSTWALSTLHSLKVCLISPMPSSYERSLLCQYEHTTVRIGSIISFLKNPVFPMHSQGLWQYVHGLHRSGLMGVLMPRGWVDKGHRPWLTSDSQLEDTHKPLQRTGPRRCPCSRWPIQNKLRGIFAGLCLIMHCQGFLSSFPSLSYRSSTHIFWLLVLCFSEIFVCVNMLVTESMYVSWAFPLAVFLLFFSLFYHILVCLFSFCYYVCLSVS